MNRRTTEGIVLCDTVSHIYITSVGRGLRNQFMPWRYDGKSNVHKCAYQQLTNGIIFCETYDNVIYLQYVLSILHDTEESHLRNSWIAGVDTYVEFILKQDRFPCYFGVACYLQLECNLYSTSVACSNDFFDIDIFTLLRE